MYANVFVIYANVCLQYFLRVDDEWMFKTPLQSGQMCPSVWLAHDQKCCLFWLAVIACCVIEKCAVCWTVCNHISDELAQSCSMTLCKVLVDFVWRVTHCFLSMYETIFWLFHICIFSSSLPLFHCPSATFLSFYISSTASISKSIWRVLVPSCTEGTSYVTATLLIGLNKKTCSWPRNLIHIYTVPLIHFECVFVTCTVLVET